MQIGTYSRGVLLSNVEVRSTFIDKIKAKLFEDGKLNRLLNKVVYGKFSYSTRECKV